MRKKIYSYLFAGMLMMSCVRLGAFVAFLDIALKILNGVSMSYMVIKIGKATDIFKKDVEGIKKDPKNDSSLHRSKRQETKELAPGDDGNIEQRGNPDALKKVFAGDIPREITEIIEFLSNPEKFLRLGVDMPKGILLVGPPGTGKTSIARGIAQYAGCTFLAVNATEFIEIYVGTGAKRIRELFDNARYAIESGESKAAIIFIDEIDAIGGRREGDVSKEYQQTLLQLLTLMDGFNQQESIVVIAATNRADYLDPALLRPGRFDRKVLVGLPTTQSRYAILQHYMERCPLAQDVDVTVLAEATAGFSGAQLKNLVNESAIRAARENAESVAQRHFLLALTQVYSITLDHTHTA